MFALTRTPLGRMLNAVRDNPERVEFVGYNTQRVRYIAFMISGLFSGIAGGLAALNFEIVTAEVVGAGAFGRLPAVRLPRRRIFFFGPIIGAVLMVVALVLLSELTQAWLLYLGLIFVFMVMYAPGGIASLIMMNLRVAAFGKLRPLLGSYLALFGTGSDDPGRRRRDDRDGLPPAAQRGARPELQFMGATLNVQRASTAGSAPASCSWWAWRCSS